MKSESMGILGEMNRLCGRSGVWNRVVGVRWGRGLWRGEVQGMPHGARFVRKSGRAVSRGLGDYSCWCRTVSGEAVEVV